jgi:hypothetical protein
MARLLLRGLSDGRERGSGGERTGGPDRTRAAADETPHGGVIVPTTLIRRASA